MIVVDASVLTQLLIDDAPAGNRARDLLTDEPEWSAPDHLQIEVIAAIRGRWRGGHLSTERARDALIDLSELTFTQIPTAALSERIWELRHNLTAYDAAYVAAAELLGCTLITADLRLARAAGPRCPIAVSSAPPG